jgi:hypothetical protein
MAHPPGVRLLNDEQHQRLYDLYMREARSPSDCVPIMMSEFEGLKITPRQITNYVQQRKWSKRKKALLSKAERRASKLVHKMAESIAQRQVTVAEKHQAFLEKSASVGAKILTKAEAIIDTTGNARDLASAANAAAKGIELYRKSVGLDGEGKSGSLAGSGSTFNFNFINSPGSPFAPKQNEIAVEAEVVQEEDDEGTTPNGVSQDQGEDPSETTPNGVTLAPA